VADGHTLVIDLERRATAADGTVQAPDNHEKVSIELGAPANPPGFDTEVTGMTVGESRSFTLSYPADYAVAELAGTSVAYTVHLKELRRRVVPALDDEFAKDLGEARLARRPSGPACGPTSKPKPETPRNASSAPTC
jgi:trigger factor